MGGVDEINYCVELVRINLVVFSGDNIYIYNICSSGYGFRDGQNQYFSLKSGFL